MNLRIDDYIKFHSDTENDILKELSRETHLKVLFPRMLSGHIQGRILSMISKMINPKYILEIGTYTGYSAQCLAEGLQDGGMLHTIEIDEELLSFAKSFVLKAGLSERITFYTGSALQIIPELDYEYDLVFIDGDKREYPQYYQLAKNKVKQGGFILADNVLWNGKVIEPLAHNDLYTKGIVEFNELVLHDSEVEKVILPIRDGITIIRKK
jgi:caffeoyl-CoA O-methyltransferase